MSFNSDLDECLVVDETNLDHQDRTSLASFSSSNTTDSDKVSQNDDFNKLALKFVFFFDDYCISLLNLKVFFILLFIFPFTLRYYSVLIALCCYEKVDFIYCELKMLKVNITLLLLKSALKA